MDIITQTKNLELPLTPPATEEWEWMDLLCESGEKNMERDSKLFEALKKNGGCPILRFYRWARPTLSYGRTQGLDAETEQSFKAQAWDVVRRPTGGGIVQHTNDLCFTLLWRKQNQSIPWEVNDSYRAIHRWIQLSLEQIGIDSSITFDQPHSSQESWCFQSPVKSDLSYRGKKIVGGAQWRSGDTALHQGSIQSPIPDYALPIFKLCFGYFFRSHFHLHHPCYSNN